MQKVAETGLSLILKYSIKIYRESPKHVTVIHYSGIVHSNNNPSYKEAECQIKCIKLS